MVGSFAKSRVGVESKEGGGHVNLRVGGGRHMEGGPCCSLIPGTSGNQPPNRLNWTPNIHSHLVFEGFQSRVEERLPLTIT